MVLLSEAFDHLTEGVQDLKPERLGLKLYMNGVFYIFIYSFKPHWLLVLLNYILSYCILCAFSGKSQLLQKRQLEVSNNYLNANKSYM